MTAKILDGKEEAAALLREVAEGVAVLAGAGRKACLAAIQANNDPGSDWYAQAQAKHCRAHGVEHRLVRLPADAGEADLARAIATTAADPGVSGIILLTPLPAGVDQLRMAATIPPEKDAEGVHPANLGRLLVAGQVDPAPCTAMAALRLIQTAKPDLSGTRALVIGRSATVGKPLALLLLAENATVTIAHTRSDLRSAMLDAEVVAAATGAAGARWRAYERRRNAWERNGGEKPAFPCLEPLVALDMVRRGAVVIDIGDNSVPVGLDADGRPLLDGKGRAMMQYVGDVDFERVSEVAGFITKPRGSVGPLTNAFLLRNVVRAALREAGKTL